MLFQSLLVYFKQKGLAPIKTSDLTESSVKNMVKELQDTWDNILLETWPKIKMRLPELLQMTLNPPYTAQKIRGWLNVSRISESITSLDLSHCHLKFFPHEFQNFTRLTKLDLSGNEIYKLPDWIKHFTYLKELNLSKNRLTHVPDELGSLMYLFDVDLSGNALTSIPASIGNCKKLYKLQVQDNQLETLPESLVNCLNLHYLDITNNFLSPTPGFLWKMKLEESYFIPQRSFRTKS